MGTITPRGVYKYADTDTAPDAASLFNLGMDALDDLLAKLPRDVQAKATPVPSVGGAGVYPAVNVVFDRAFDAVPVVTATPSSPAATVGVSNVTADGFTITVQRPGSSTTTVVQWTAVQL